MPPLALEQAALDEVPGRVAVELEQPRHVRALARCQREVEPHDQVALGARLRPSHQLAHATERQLVERDIAREGRLRHAHGTREQPVAHRPERDEVLLGQLPVRAVRPLVREAVWMRLARTRIRLVGEHARCDALEPERDLTFTREHERGTLADAGPRGAESPACYARA